MGGEAAPEVAVQGFFLRKVDSGGLTIKSDSANAAFLAENGATDLVIAVGTRRGGGLGETKGELDPFVFHGCALFVRYVQAVENPVKDGGEDDSEECDEDDSREEGVRGGEYLGGDGGQALAVDGALSAHEHGGFDKGIFPSQSSEVVIPEDSDSEGDADQADGHGQMKQDAAEEDGVRGQRFAVVLEGQERDSHETLVADGGGDGKRWEGVMGKRREEVGRSWIRTSEGVSQQIYSLPRLATSVSARKGKDSQKSGVGSKAIPRKNMVSWGLWPILGEYEICIGHACFGARASRRAGFGGGGEVGSG